ncbi:MAG: 3-keto-5-aminohexanoate cleavage protein [Kiloniellales bacterium]|nr:3-keto-5-aminohexanoate cleavage protein [Kiloniellales bacterium]
MSGADAPAPAQDRPPVILAVAPNGARKTKADHPALPIAPAEIAAAALACRAAGAAMIHLHVRDAEGRHSLDVEAYRAASEAVRDAVGRDLVIQVTSEAVGVYSPEAQMAMVRALRPEAVSLAIREIVPDAAGEAAAGEFLAWLRAEGVLPQYILYSDDDLRRFDDLLARGVVPAGRQAVLFVLGRYAKDQTSEPKDLLPFLAANARGHLWAVCAFGPRETACAVAAAALGGHARVGFENNLHLPDGTLAPDNAALVAAVAEGLDAIGARPASAEEAREMMRP